PSTSTANTKGTSTKTDKTGEAKPATNVKDATVPAPSTNTVPLSKAQQKLQANDALRAKLISRLPRGMDPMTAAAGFRNLGQFVAAVNVSNSQGIDFNLL